MQKMHRTNFIGKLPKCATLYRWFILRPSQNTDQFFQPPKSLRSQHRPWTAESFLWNRSWPYNAFDITLGMFFQFAGPVERNILWQKMLDATSPGGLIAIHGYTPKQLEFGTGGPPHVKNMYTKESFEAVFHDCDMLTLIQLKSGRRWCNKCTAVECL